MTDEQIKQNADIYSDKLYKDGRCTEDTAPTIQEIYITGAHSRDEEIKELKEQRDNFKDRLLDALEKRDQLRNPWITDRDPEIKGSISYAVLLLVDGMFYKVSRLERRKDGSEFWWGVDVANGEEVTAWMPIPELEEGK